MRCLLCGKFSLKSVCRDCYLEFIIVAPLVREMGDFRVISFFEYANIAPLLYAKYSKLGNRIYCLLAQAIVQSLKKRNVSLYGVCGVGVDDKIRHGYAHNAILLRHLKQLGLQPLYQTLHARNPISYAGKDLAFRQRNPRDFMIKREVRDKKIILVDDVITSGLTLQQAKECLETNGAQVLHAFVLADASTKGL
ncbi:ComF family protein [Helicobacter sp.]|uniref:ComF family protein n=1 Tax=Helicobacter sp. TaxID=218 RepID=UPI0025BEA4D3|nr:phosphoribosyltransferase family protein [Helicobacter sp.]MCI5969453.1 ComF family protein [Helicobacter sp.]MDY2584226.1 phosphoribosyltransferase family protein [Helicobacter sp.]